MIFPSRHLNVLNIRLQNDLNRPGNERGTSIGDARSASRPIYRVLQNDVYKRSPPVFSPTSLFTVPQASTPPRPHSHDPQRRATFGTTSPRCTYGEGLASPCRRWSLARVIVPGVYDDCSCATCARARARLCTCICSMVDGRRSLTHRSSPGAESSSVRLAGTIRHLVVSVLSFFFFSIFFSLAVLLHLPSYTLVSFPISRFFMCPGERRSSVNTLTRRAR